MDDPTHQEAWDQIEADLRDKWENCGSTWGAWFSHRKRERLWIELQAVKQFRRKLASFAGQARD